MAATEKEKPLSKGVIFGTSGLGGVLGWIVVHPFNTLAVRMNLESMKAGGGSGASFGGFASNLIRNEGVSSLYAGLGAGCLRQVFYATSRYGLFETFRDMLAKYRKTDFAQRFATASVAGGCAALISCPIEVCLVRMSNDASLPAAEKRNYKSVFDAIIRIGRDEGIPTFWSGSQPFVMRAMVVGGTQVATYDQFKSIYSGLGLGSGLANQFASSMSAGLIYSLITMPLESAKNRCPARGHTRQLAPAVARFAEAVHAVLGSSTRPASLHLSACLMPTLKLPGRWIHPFRPNSPAAVPRMVCNVCNGDYVTYVTVPIPRMAFMKPDAAGKMPYTSTFQTLGAVARAEVCPGLQSPRALRPAHTRTFAPCPCQHVATTR